MFGFRSSLEEIISNDFERKKQNPNESIAIDSCKGGDGEGFWKSVTSHARCLLNRHLMLSRNISLDYIPLLSGKDVFITFYCDEQQ